MIYFTETLRAAEVQPARAVPSVPLPTRGTSLFPRWKDPKAHSESHASLQAVYFQQWPRLLPAQTHLSRLCILQDKDFLKPLLHKMHVNPPAEVSTSMKVTQILLFHFEARSKNDQIKDDSVFSCFLLCHRCTRATLWRRPTWERTSSGPSPPPPETTSSSNSTGQSA